eukprot:CAMPEP_0114490028 /NCGR_PEP_ID=MMETSP0109-20121206/2210_1 /TAXON_ID=29199 /ORGANISM="Chlorarachnion reptans, Strain CCCM449" /LENGTH=291 /DNA_ID=CAMNT_0001666591 /DNA_START=593 /DNA_END=1464 /DNA_ORIENTATION=+
MPRHKHREEVVAQLGRRHLLPRRDEEAQHGGVRIGEVVLRVERAGHAALLLRLQRLPALLDEILGRLANQRDGVGGLFLPRRDSLRDWVAELPNREEVQRAPLGLLERRVHRRDDRIGLERAHRVEVVVEDGLADDVEGQLREHLLHVDLRLRRERCEHLRRPLRAVREDAVHHRVQVLPVQGRRDGPAADLPLLAVGHREPVSEQELGDLPHEPLLVRPVRVQDVLGGGRVGDDHEARGRACRQQVDAPELALLLEALEDEEEGTAEQLADVRGLVDGDGDLGLPEPQPA